MKLSELLTNDASLSCHCMPGCFLCVLKFYLHALVRFSITSPDMASSTPVMSVVGKAAVFSTADTLLSAIYI